MPTCAVCTLVASSPFNFVPEPKLRSYRGHIYINMPIYISKYWIVTCCVLILWIFFFFFKVKYILLLDSWNEMQSLFT